MLIVTQLLQGDNDDCDGRHALRCAALHYKADHDGRRRALAGKFVSYVRVSNDTGTGTGNNGELCRRALT